MNDNRNLMLAVILSAIVLLGWNVIFPQDAPPPALEQTQDVVDGKVVAKDVPSVGPAVQTPVAKKDRKAALSDSPRLKLASDNLAGTINLQGARIDDLLMTQQSETLAKDSPAVRLFSPAGADGAYFAQFGWTGQGVEVPSGDTVWTASGETLAPGKPVTLSWENGTGQTFEILMSLDDGFMFDVKQRVTNKGDGAIAVRPYGLISRADKSTDTSMWTIHIGPMSFLNEEADYGLDWDDLDENKAGTTRSGTGGWLGFTDKYWLAALVPDQASSIDASFRKSGSGAYQADFTSDPVIVAPGQTSEADSRLFAGAKEAEWLAAYEEQGVTKLSKAIDWGWFEWFMRPIFWLLRELFALTGNFGVAIIGLTLIVKAALLPIANKQFRSMAQMKKIQPKMKALQDRFKDDKPRLQQEMLKLYQTEKVNPASGCLPIFIQMPVFYALYKVLMVSVEMRHQPFALWIKDLSAPDPMTPLNLFGLLNFTPPALIAIGVLPILLGISMWLQFKLNPAPTDPIQQQVFSIMPWVLMFVMAPFAAGLVLYWITNNVVTLIQQKIFYRKYELNSVDASTATIEAKATKK